MCIANPYITNIDKSIIVNNYSLLVYIGLQSKTLLPIIAMLSIIHVPFILISFEQRTSALTAKRTSRELLDV